MEASKMIEKAEARAEKEFAFAICEIERTLHQLKHHYSAFEEGDASEKADRLSGAASMIRAMAAHIDLARLGALAAELDVLSELD